MSQPPQSQLSLYIHQQTPRARPPRPNLHRPPRPNFQRPSKPIPPEDPYLTDAKKFMNLYFDTMDNKREKMNELYRETCRLLFNGNPFCGPERISEFWQQQFPSSVHKLRVQDYKNHGNRLLILTTSGEVILDTVLRAFSHVLVCQRQNGQWKIMSDQYRLLN